MDERCEICRFAKEGPDALRCRRYPPQIVEKLSDYGHWPLVYKTDWCGEFKPIPPAPGPVVQPVQEGGGDVTQKIPTSEQAMQWAREVWDEKPPYPATVAANLQRFAAKAYDAAAPQWISVAERLPEIVQNKESKLVLVTDGESYACAYWVRGLTDAMTGKPQAVWMPEHINSGDDNGVWLDFDPAHWMALPPPPEPPKT